MQPRGSIIVKLQRPSARVDGPPGAERMIEPPPDAPWLLSDATDLVDLIAPSAELSAMLDSETGYFYARPSGDGWDIIAQAPVQRW